jgi:hypothetical protein
MFFFVIFAATPAPVLHGYEIFKGAVCAVGWYLAERNHWNFIEVANTTNKTTNEKVNRVCTS